MGVMGGQMEERVYGRPCGAYVGGQIPPPSPPPPDTVTSRLEGAIAAQIDCGQCIVQIENALGIEPPHDAPAAPTSCGINGLTMNLRSGAMEMAERLTRILTTLGCSHPE